MTGRLGGGQRAFSHLYAMRMVNNLTGEIRSLHQDTTMYQVKMIAMVVMTLLALMMSMVMTVDVVQVHEQYAGQEEEWRHELRVGIKS